MGAHLAVARYACSDLNSDVPWPCIVCWLWVVLNSSRSGRSAFWTTRAMASGRAVAWTCNALVHRFGYEKVRSRHFTPQRASCSGSTNTNRKPGPSCGNCRATAQKPNTHTRWHCCVGAWQLSSQRQNSQQTHHKVVGDGLEVTPHPFLHDFVAHLAKLVVQRCF